MNTLTVQTFVRHKQGCIDARELSWETPFWIAKAALCALADEKQLKKLKFKVPYEQGKNIEL